MRSVAVVVALAACLHAGVWALRQTQASAPSVDGILNSVSYSPFTTASHPDLEGSRPPEERIRAELKAIAVGNEALFRSDLTGDELAEVVKRFKREVGGAVPVSTGEIYSELLGPDEEDADQPKPSNALNLVQRLSGAGAELQDPKERA